MSGWRALQVAGLGLAGVMLILMRVGTTSEGTFVVWIISAIAGLGLFAIARRVDEDIRKRKRDDEFRLRSGR